MHRPIVSELQMMNLLGTVPFNCASRELYAHGKVVPRFCQTINHPSDLRKLSCLGCDEHFFARRPGTLADHASTVGTNIFRKRSLASVGFFQACDVGGNRGGEALLNPAIKKPLVGSAMCRTVHYWLPRGEEGSP